MFGWRRATEGRPGPRLVAPRGAAAADAAGGAIGSAGGPAAGVSGGSGDALPSEKGAQAVLDRLEWTVLRRLDGLLQGDYRTLFRGFGMDLADLREYQPNDDVRHIDWNVTARMALPHVREFQEDREVAAWFLVDLSASIDFGSGRVGKRAVATDLVGLLARLLTRHGNRVGAVLFDGHDLTMVPARAGRRHVLHLLDRMSKVDKAGAKHARPARGRREAASAPAGETDLRLLIAGATPVIARRSVVFVVSDFISRPGWGRALAQLTRRHEVIAVRVYDPLEVALPDLGLLVLQDAETGEQMFVDTRDKGFRRRFEVQAEQREQALREALGEAGVDCLELATDERLDEALLNFAKLRKRRSQLSAGAGQWTRA